MMRIRRGAVLVIPMVFIAACSLPTDERATRYDADDLPEEIANTTTTTTTTTTTVAPTTLPPEGTIVTNPPVPTTQPPTLTAPVDLYYTVGFSDDLVQVRRDLQEGAPLRQVLAQLEQPLPEIADFGLRTAVPSTLIAEVRVDRGVATVELDPATVDGMSDTNRRRAVAQLVLTVTSYRSTDRGGIGRIRFERAGEGYAVFVPAFGGSSLPGEELAFEDFGALIEGTPATPTTEPPATTSAPSTSVPAATTPPQTGDG